MSNAFLELATTPSVKAAQAANGSRELWSERSGRRSTDRITHAEARFLAERDSFYLATVSEDGWPYVQHRGGPPGFLRVLDEKTLGFLDFAGNRQYISLGNSAANDRVALLLMDYVNRRRLKIYAHLEPRALTADPQLTAQLALPGYKATAERAFLLHVRAFDWNCPKHITPRFTAAELEDSLSSVRTRLAALEAENKALRAQLVAESQGS